MADELKENVTTPWMQNELTAEEINAYDKNGENTIFWILRGKGSGRDRYISLNQLRKWIDFTPDTINEIQKNGLKSIDGAFEFVSRSGQTATFSANEVRFRLAHGEECVVGADSITLNNKSSSIVITSEGVEIKNSDGSTAAKFAAGGEFGTLLSRSGLEVQKGTSKLQDVTAETGTFRKTLKALENLIVVKDAFFGNEDCRIQLIGGSVIAPRMVSGNWLRTDTYVGYNVYSATTVDDVKDPNVLLSDVQKEKGASVLVSNDSGVPVSITRQASGSNLMTLVVNPGEMLWYVYNGISWVHSW